MAKAKSKKITIEDALVPVEEQPYEVPENWCWTKVKYVSEVVTGSTPSKKREEYYGGSFPFFKPADLDAGDNVVDATEYLSDEGKAVSRIVPRLSTAVCCIGTIGKSGLLKIEGTTNQQINSMIPRINPLYVYFYSKTNEFVRELWNKSTSTTISMVNKSNMETNSIPLPPLQEQQRIVKQIESMFSKLDEAKEKVRSVIDNHEQFVTALLYKAFDGEISKDWRMNHVHASVWRNATIGELFSHSAGKALKKDNKDGTLQKYITTSNLYWGRFDFSEIREMYFKESEIEKCTAKKGDLLICNGGDVGRAAIWDYEYNICLQNHVSRLRKKEDNVDVRFFYYFFMLAKRKGEVNGTGIGISSLSSKSISEMKVKLPSKEEQVEIADILESVLKMENHAFEEAENILGQIELMKKAVLAKAFRGELGTNDPSEESSIELLKHIIES